MLAASTVLLTRPQATVNQVMAKVIIARVKVTEMLPLTLAPKGKIGINPIRLLIRMCCPIGSCPSGNSTLATVCPSTATAA